MTQPKKQLGGRKEAPIEVTGSPDLSSDQQFHEKTLSLDDAEYERYRELVKGFLEKFTRWNEIFNDKLYRRHPDPMIMNAHKKKISERFRDFQVLQTPHGLTISPIEDNIPLERNATWGQLSQNRVLTMTRVVHLDEPELPLLNREFIIRLGQGGKHIIFDPDNTPLEEIEIHISHDYSFSHISIQAQRQEKILGEHRYRSINYYLEGDTLEISYKYGFHDVMTDEMATNLINAVNSLIPQIKPQLLEPPTVEEL